LTSALDKVHDEEIKSKGGLKVQMHPSLMVSNQTFTNKYAPILPKFSSIKANQKLVKEEKIQLKSEKKQELNPYLQPADTKIVPTKRPRELKFNEPGKFVQLANEIRTQEKLQKLKEEIEETARKAGLERELELVSNNAIRNDPPPIVEWWDTPFVTESYDDFDSNRDFSNLITNLVQHPVPIEPPGEGPPPPPRPLMLTKKEQKKMRRQNRLETQREKQDKIRLGLLPPEQPRITKSNFMRVLGQEAVLAPSMVEAEMAKQVKERQEKHKALIEASKLTQEEKREKKDEKLREDTSTLAYVAVFKYFQLTRIKSMEHRQHLFKINTNAQQFKLSGTGIVSPILNLVIVEGGPKGIKSFKNLMLNRIKWEEHVLENQETNECILIWEGTVPKKLFHYFKIKNFKTTTEVKEFLTNMDAVNYWNAARTFLTEEY
jgi:U4/U6 small nuclear ribonucleoprotein PRP3